MPFGREVADCRRMGAAGVGKRSAHAESQGGEVDNAQQSPSRPTAYDMSISAVCVKCNALWLGLSSASVPRKARG